MARLNIMIDDNLAKRLRLRSVELYDGEKGALSHAIAEAIEQWLDKSPRKK